jgi:hypothetical protein
VDAQLLTGITKQLSMFETIFILPGYLAGCFDFEWLSILRMVNIYVS